MTIPDAIQRLQDSLDHNTILITSGDKNSIKLGIEALTLVIWLRDGHIPAPHFILPGETK